VLGAEVWYLPGGDLRRGLVDVRGLVDLIESREADWAGAGEGWEQQQAGEEREEERGEESHVDLSFLSEFDVVDVLDFDFLSDLMRLTWLTLIFWSNLICWLGWLDFWERFWEEEFERVLRVLLEDMQRVLVWFCDREEKERCRGETSFYMFGTCLSDSAVWV
jgi:hypothetical protein